MVFRPEIVGGVLGDLMTAKVPHNPFGRKGFIDEDPVPELIFLGNPLAKLSPFPRSVFTFPSIFMGIPNEVYEDRFYR